MTGPPLVTGAAGFAGSHLLDELLRTNPSVAAWASPRGRLPGPADSRVHWSAVDLLDPEAVARAIADLRPAAVYHCAGVPHVAESWGNPRRVLEVNVMGTHHVLEALLRAGHRCPVLVTGSALIYHPAAAPLTEDHPIGPSSPYGVSKLAQEMLAARAPGLLPVYLARPFNHAGPRQSPDFVTSSFAKQIAEIEAGLSEPVLRVGNLTARRDITDVRDTVRAYRLIVERGVPRRPYNVCAGQAYRISDLLETLLGLSRVRVTLEEDPTRMRPSDIPTVLGDRSRIGAEIGWQPELPIERTLADLLDYWRNTTPPPAAGPP